MKVIPAYLPQYHQIPENDEWWGEGFTEWTNVKAAKPLFEGHQQPRVPMDNNYYDLTNVESLKWQCKIAREHGIYGFSMYHYWFNGKLLLEKPMELLLAHPEIDIHYCISWANHEWTNGWKASGKQVKTLISINYNDENDWVAHFNYMLPFFKDPRYISEDNKPFMIIYIPQLVTKLNDMLKVWDQMAKDNGFDGLTFLYQSAPAYTDHSWDRRQFKYGILFNPDFALRAMGNSKKRKVNDFIVKYASRIKSKLKIKRSLSFEKAGLKYYNYDEVWNTILTQMPITDNLIPSAYVDWDNTPRRENRGSVHIGASPEKFKKYFKALVEKTIRVSNQDKMFVFAWNEWAEGGYLEPDTRYGMGYLDAIKEVLTDLNLIEND